MAAALGGGRQEILTIVDLMIAKVQERLKERDMGLELLPAARTLLSERGYHPGQTGEVLVTGW